MKTRSLLVVTAIGLAVAAAVAIVLLSVSGGDRAPASPTAATQAVAVPTVRLKLITGALTQPLGVTAPPGDTHRLFVVEKIGVVRIISDGKLLSSPFLSIRGKVSGGSEQGLLSLTFDPHYGTNRRFYVDYTDKSGDIKVVRYVTSSDPNRASAGSATVLWTVAHHAHPNHNGGQLAFGPDGLLYIGVGDGGGEGDPNDYGQNLNVPYAKIWRLDVDTPGAKPVLYAYGLRNPWRFSFDRNTGALWIGDVGQNHWEEVDYLKPGTSPGTNFGWSYYEGDHVFRKQPIVRARLVFPLVEYSHSVGDAIIGGFVYRGSAIPGLRGFYVYGDYGTARVWVKAGPRGAVHILAGVSQKLPNISSFGQSAKGELFVSSLDGRLYKLVP